MVLYPTPGLAIFSAGAGSVVRQEYWTGTRMFAVVDGSFIEVFIDGTRTTWGVVANDGKTAYIVAGISQVFIASNGHGYCFTLATNAFLIDPPGLASAVMVDYSDGYFVALRTDGRWQVTLDGTNWDPTLVSQVSVFSETPTAIIVDHREVIVGGPKRGVIYQDTGNTFPFDVIPGGFFEQGIAAPQAVCRLDNTVFWIGADERGALVGYRAQGQIPQRISNHAIEFAWQGYSTFTDAYAFTYQDQGHAFWLITFPSANSGRGATWVYDVATSMWHERSFFFNGLDFAHRARCHAWAFNKHLVGDRASGNIYQMAIPIESGSVWTFCDDFGNTIHRVRRSPWISAEQQRIRHYSLQVDLEVGLGPIPPLTDVSGNPRDPQIMLRWSDDQARTWRGNLVVDCGQAGKYKKRVIARRLGVSRARVYEVSCSDPVPIRITDSYLKADPGYAPQERITKELGKRA